MGLEAEISASRMGFWPQEWDLGLKDRIWTLRLGFRPRDWDLGLIVGFGWGGAEKETPTTEDELVKRNERQRFYRNKRLPS